MTAELNTVKIIYADKDKKGETETVEVECVDVDPDTWEKLNDEIMRMKLNAREGGRDPVEYTVDCCTPLWQEIVSDDAKLRRWSGFDKKGFALLYDSFIVTVLYFTVNF